MKGICRGARNRASITVLPGTLLRLRPRAAGTPTRIPPTAAVEATRKEIHSA
jgi:hypothetical protein